MVEPRPPKPRKADEEREVDFLICNQCGTPCYVFESDRGKITEAQCLVCGNDSPGMFNIGEEAGAEDD